MADPFNYSALLGQGQQLVPNVLDQEIQRSLGRAQIEQTQANTALLGQKMRQSLVETQEQQEYSRQVEEALASGDQRRILALIARFPQFKDALKANWDGMDQLQQRSDLRQAAGIWSALNAGNTDAAIKQLEDRITADREAGQDTADDEEQLALLKSGDPKSINSVKGRLGLFMASVVPEKFAAVVDQLGTGTDEEKPIVVGRAVGHYERDADGNRVFVPDYRDPDPTQYRDLEVVDPATGETRKAIVAVGGGNGGTSSTPVSGRTQGGWTPRARNGGDNDDAAVDNKITGAAQYLGVDPNADISSIDPMKIATAMTLSEGGKGSLADRNNNPGNLRNGDGSYKKFPTKQAGLNAAAALVARKLRNGQTTVRTMIEGLPVGGAVASSGAPTVAAMGAPTGAEKTRLITPQEVQSLIAQGYNLDPTVSYQQSKEGTITPVGGQKQGQLKPWPAAALEARTTNNAALKTLQSASWLLNPQNTSKEAKVARDAIGPVVGRVGGNYINKEGTSARSTIGKIGAILIKDTSGAAVSLAEDARLAKWVPLVTDTPEVARAKLGTLIRELMGRNQAMDDTYSEDQGFRPFKQPRGGGQQGGSGGFRILGVRPK
ncbi:hypothetical protein [Sphingobium sp. YC-XJ3]|uniref:hypothetical protein n=1 Tax=Sphingobium sp. YC-XJ3 TaxID=3024245 RepID=UPI002361FCA7|nr:hypothetical protein [Sphingobium sp. YC-XJ3]WDA36398.1 hypothetical protein PO876_23715 [Sphingobium sp. YC-XJ3]